MITTVNGTIEFFILVSFSGLLMRLVEKNIVTMTMTKTACYVIMFRLMPLLKISESSIR